MRLNRPFTAMVVLITFVMILFLNLNPDLTHTLRSGAKDLQKSEGTTPALVERSSVEPQRSVVVSEAFRSSIPQNGAYWNRLFYFGLKLLDEGGKALENASDWSHCKENNLETLQTNMHDFTSYPSRLQSFLQAINCKSPPVLLNQPGKCASGPTFLLLAIKSNLRNFEERQAVRETWGREGEYERGLRVRTVFLLGTSQADVPDLNPLLTFEAKYYGDIVQWDFQDSFFNLTLKMNTFLQWTIKHCPNVSFVFSGDDDVFVNTPALLGYLQSLEASKASRLYTGDIISTASPHRDPKNKYYIPTSFYEGPYPAYAGGGGYVFSGALLQNLSSILNLIPFFPIDDVYVGMCFMALEVAPESNPQFRTFDIKVEDRENLCIHKNILLVHRRSPSESKRLWKGIHNPLLTC
ncbi:N-acetyllactosaminide beta-1,3-N-acetylglucosaminyltransferase 2 [Betta splendens]|uniref:Hexosyltransferase n=1 Tax=Betta splendens TaxID=158456 RepID=A0A6P7P7B6_BETSP|nr:N-acetyllactosaminide beta-1,3-N-acetylglucosaminyltransferase 2 [Betta splendens]XP_029026084.1 N-acetyllactosaminide beta-1,3-N-acetylglucosaminyltransferase 2 [Betta splendens]XP_029026085.1 N-acetyllactosaminide beta-1,3-N-acetylglucosaminyltransferase 2 [Betta splendens]XP_055369816.1 N-acetyllactosaminide beta-1,3-N-acetylglucosaminyltransferase 2 [Betta splendens]